MQDDIYLSVPKGLFVITTPDPGLTWYGVLHISGSLKVKRYFDYLDLQEAQDSTFTAWVTRVFEADNAEAAMVEAQRQVTARFIL